VDGEMHSETSTQHPGEAVGERGEELAGSGWTTTKQAAKVLGVSRRSVQGYVRQGILEARDEGEGVNKRFLVSIDSLNALSTRRKREAGARANFAEPSAGLEERAKLAANTDEGLRHLIARLEARTEEATELRIRLELTEKAQSTLEDDLAEERRLREEAEREREDLRRKLEALREPPQGAGTLEEARERAQPQSAAGEAQETAQRPWWRRVFNS
jgi:chromosome segregation ATPase